MSICTQKEFLIESKLNGFWGGFVVTLGVRNFHMGGEVNCQFRDLPKSSLLWKDLPFDPCYSLDGSCFPLAMFGVGVGFLVVYLQGLLTGTLVFCFLGSP